MHRLYTPYPPKKHVTTGVRVGVPFSSRDVIIRYECEQLVTTLNHFFLYAETGLCVLVGTLPIMRTLLANHDARAGLTRSPRAN
jgi:hypothetical protein